MFVTTKHEQKHFKMVSCIDNFPSFAASKSGFSTDSVHMCGIEWFIRIEFSRFDPRIGMSQSVADTAYRAEWLDLFAVGKRTVRKDFSADVTMDFKFKNSLAPGGQAGCANSPDTFRFDFNASNNYEDHMGIGLIKVDV